MKILLTGASGFIGRHVEAALCRAGHCVVPVSRRHGIDMTGLLAPADWKALLGGVDAVVNAVGIIGETRSQSFEALHTRAPMALFRACADGGVRRVLQISALGADETAFSGYHLSKRAADDALRSLPLDWFVLRPSLVYGSGGASARLFMRLASWPLVPVVDDGKQWIQPVHIRDLVDTVLQCLGSSGTRRTLDVVGPQVICMADWLQLLRSARGLAPAPLLRVPHRLAAAVAALGQGLSPMLRPDNLRMLRAGSTADSRPLLQFLGRPLLEPTPDLLSHSLLPQGSRA